MPTHMMKAGVKELDLGSTQVTDAGCATLAAALDSGALPALEDLSLGRTGASPAAKAALVSLMGGQLAIS